MDSDSGRVGVADQALVSDQAAARLAPSGFDPSRYHVGQRLWLKGAQRYQVDGYVIVSKVGRKWASLVSERGYSAGRVAIGTRNLGGGDYGSPGRLYADENDWLHHQELDRVWTSFRNDIQARWARPEHLTADKIRQMMAIFHDSDGSGEAGETAGLAPKGDSAGRDSGIAQPSPDTKESE